MEQALWVKEQVPDVDWEIAIPPTIQKRMRIQNSVLWELCLVEVSVVV
jgi:hypothetical protein